MDISNLKLTGSVPPAAVKVVVNTETSKPASQGNSLPGLGQIHAQSEILQTDNSPAKLNTAELNNLVDKTNAILQGRFSNLIFTVDEGTNIKVVRIEDSETGELIRQIPSEAMLAIARAIDKMQQGAMLEEKV